MRLCARIDLSVCCMCNIVFVYVCAVGVALVAEGRLLVCMRQLSANNFFLWHFRMVFSLYVYVYVYQPQYIYTLFNANILYLRVHSS